MKDHHFQSGLCAKMIHTTVKQNNRAPPSPNLSMLALCAAAFYEITVRLNVNNSCIQETHVLESNASTN